ncbi:MAG: ABC transporter permease [Phycisphaerales bacterium]|jgi:peptide/nickel transport system permease protein
MTKEERKNQNSIETQSPRQLMRKRFNRHRPAVGAFFLLQVMYLLAIFAEFFATYSPQYKNLDYAYCPPQVPRFSFSKGFYVNQMRRCTDPVTFRKTYTEEPNTISLRFFTKGEPYKLWRILSWDRHLVGIENAGQINENTASNNTQISQPTFYLLGADKYGRDIFSRIIYGARISLSVGIAAIILTFTLGLSIGGISGYVGGSTDTFIQRSIEVINSVPKLPLWLAMGAILPDDWSPLKIYFAITAVLSLLGWTRLARVVRGKLLALREEDYAVAAYLLGASHKRIIFRHLLPGFTSHIIVSITLTIPWMILGETTLSFLGVGLRPPVVSWGVMLQDCMNMTTVANYPWLLMPVVFIIVTVLCFNFLGDGLRDAADPYSQ